MIGLLLPVKEGLIENKMPSDLTILALAQFEIGQDGAAPQTAISIQNLAKGDIASA